MLGEDEVEDAGDFEDARGFPVDSREGVQGFVGGAVVCVEAGDGEVGVVVCGVDEVGGLGFGVFPDGLVAAVIAEGLEVAAPGVGAGDGGGGGDADLGGAVVGGVACGGLAGRFVSFRSVSNGLIR